ncbi:endonuclease [Photobacterium gaetbulicola]|uniref:Putative endonuclease/exonuclease/phosphatase n=1 Tax=Photobacterium gaetbulicola Gung47 TaxID=658445 RepID=A0A0C4JMZ6_9GAMM|nr:endonuclease/exonuclease/phosphatase family protein [Photobacterium gaetbulicola]AHA59196.1 putative endonuclease/exonuclease/phosphatase [Photobacterium gaetbulicola Gung47]PSU00023.1 endonuclease [Photobacterium gaetbulicola]
MATILEAPPPAVASEQQSLAGSLDATIPSKHDGNLLIGTWNIRRFGNLTRDWGTSGNDYSPKRDLRSLLSIASIISRFDVCAVQEVGSNLRALRDMMKYLGDRWAFIMTDVTRGKKGNSERLAYIFDTDRVQLSGLACELVLPPEVLGDPSNISKQFARTPYAVSFRAGSETFILVTAHILYGDSSQERVPELEAIAEWMAEWAKSSKRFHHNLILLGDFNIDRKGDPLWDAFSSTGLVVPDALNRVPRSIFHAGKDDKFYDQIAWFTRSKKAQLNMSFLDAGNFDFVPILYPSLTRQQLSHRISDHYPLWAEFARR